MYSASLMRFENRVYDVVHQHDGNVSFARPPAGEPASITPQEVAFMVRDFFAFCASQEYAPTTNKLDAMLFLFETNGRGILWALRPPQEDQP